MDWLAWLPLIVGLVGAGGLATEIVRRSWPSRAERADAADQLRDDMMRELGALRERVDRLDRELGEWKSKYYSLLADYTTLKADYQTMQSELSALRQRVDLGDCNRG